MSRSVKFKSDVLGTFSLCKGDMMKTVYEYLSVEAARTNEIAYSRMPEFGIKCCSSRERRKRGWIQQVYNQWIAGTVSFYTLQHLLDETNILGFVWSATMSVLKKICEEA